MLGATAIVRVPMVPPARPISIHGRRLPSREVVRSLSRPKKGLLTIASSDPTPVTSARFFGAWSIPTSEFTFNASETSSGARNTSAPPAYESAYRETNPGPTGAGR